MTASDPTVIRADDRHQYEALLDGEVAAIAQYRLRPGQVVFTHTETRPEFSGRGVASALARAALADVRARGEKVIARCPFIASYLADHPEYADLLADAEA
ncbi:MAG TPA: GNAT family N-acetyltransferase [Micromonosporaceae bacterium]